MSHPAGLPDLALLAECEVRRQRRSGPGGQHRNKVETAVVLVHIPTAIRAEASERRSQSLNQSVALHRLRVKLALATRSVLVAGRDDDGPSELWCSRLAGKQLPVSSSHVHFPSLLAEALDALTLAGFDFVAAAEKLRCSPSQLVRLLKREPEAFARVNAERQKNGLKALK